MSRTLGLAFRLLISLSVVGAASMARADRCPAVMILLDKSLSMDSDPSGGYSTPSRMDLAKKALSGLVKKYGNQLPIGFATYSNQDTSDCWGDIDVEVPAVNGKATEVLSKIAAVSTTGLTNTGNAVYEVSQHASLHDSTRPGSYIILVTDGEPNCGDGSLDDPDYTVKVIGDVAADGVKTFVIGFGSLPTDSAGVMDDMALASTVPCTDVSCGGRKFYAAEDQAGLDAMIEAVSQKIVGEFGGACDDSCYTNGCPNDGDACVNGECKPNPCAGFTACPTGAYCFWDGQSSQGTCKKGCKTACATGQYCNNGTCADVVDACDSITCNSGQVCYQGDCVVDKCGSTGCGAGQMCVGGQCRDDLCTFVQCPAGQTCTNHDGLCSAPTGGTSGGGGGGGGGRGNGRGAVGCNAGAGGALDLFGLLLAGGLGGGGLWLRRRRRAA